MLVERALAPPSPPTSPRMSDAGSKNAEYPWTQDTTPHVAILPASNPSLQWQAPPLPQQMEEAKGPATIRPSLRSHKSFPYSMGPSSRLQHELDPNSPTTPALAEFQERVISQGPQPTGSSDLQPATFGGSAPASPLERLTPPSARAGGSDLRAHDDEMDEEADDLGEGEERPPMTAAELRAQKRKMKRFRLTHNQTRFLMSEFARQAHPDAAHRERLSREIPGLSSRQVQVWFQNRRAKLKRLTTDDRERMMRSRALPADFDMTHTLHSPFPAGPPGLTASTPMPSPGNYASMGEASVIRPLTLDTLRRGPDYQSFGPQYSSPSGITPAIGAFAFTPPQSATDTMSPASVFSNASPFAVPGPGSPRRPPYGYPISSQLHYPSQQPHAPRLHLHERLNRPYGESAGSPLRTSMSYSGFDADPSQGQHSQRAASFSEQPSLLQNRPHQQRSLTGPTSSAPGPYGLGFTYGQMPSYHNPELHQRQQQQQQQPPPHGSPDVAAQQPPPGFHQLRRSSSHFAGPPIGHYAPHPSQFAGPPMQPFPQFAGQYHAPIMPDPFAQHSQEQQQQQQRQPQQQQQGPQPHPTQPFPTLPSQRHQFAQLENAAENEVDEDDGSDGGVPVPVSYR